MEIAHCRTACASWADKAGCAPSISRTPRGRMSTRRRRWPMQRVSLSSSSAEYLLPRGLPVSKPATMRQMAFRTFAAVSGATLLAYLIWRVGPGNLLDNISTLGWGLALIIALGGVAHVV